MEKEADWIDLSFVRSSSDYDVISSKIKKAGQTTPVMAKIEKWEAVQCLDDIIKSFDAVMVATRPVAAGVDIQLVAAYETLSEPHWNAPHIEVNFVPNWVVDNTNTIDDKKKALP